jgi:peptide deformylase
VTVLKVIEWPAKVLETRASEVTVFDAAFRKFVADMHETMKDAGGIGLAANQVNSLQRVLTIEIPYDNSRYSDQEEEKKEDWHDKNFTFVNPVITKKEGKISFQEGCLSFPEIYDFVDRAAEVWVKAKDENGKEFEVHANGLFAVCLQHEIDHLDGIVFINRMSRLKSSLIKKKIQRRSATLVTEEA